MTDQVAATALSAGATPVAAFRRWFEIDPGRIDGFATCTEDLQRVYADVALFLAEGDHA